MDTIKREVKVGDAVRFFDSYKKEHAALVTAVHSQTCINVVFVSEDVTKSDTYGRQIERQTSVSHISSHLSEDKTEFFGMCFQ